MNTEIQTLSYNYVQLSLSRYSFVYPAEVMFNNLNKFLKLLTKLFLVKLFIFLMDSFVQDADNKNYEVWDLGLEINDWMPSSICSDKMNPRNQMFQLPNKSHGEKVKVEIEEDLINMLNTNSNLIKGIPRVEDNELQIISDGNDNITPESSITCESNPDVLQDELEQNFKDCSPQSSITSSSNTERQLIALENTKKNKAIPQRDESKNEQLNSQRFVSSDDKNVKFSDKFEVVMFDDEIVRKRGTEINNKLKKNSNVRNSKSSPVRSKSPLKPAADPEMNYDDMDDYDLFVTLINQQKKNINEKESKNRNNNNNKERLGSGDTNYHKYQQQQKQKNLLHSQSAKEISDNLFREHTVSTQQKLKKTDPSFRMKLQESMNNDIHIESFGERQKLRVLMRNEGIRNAVMSAPAGATPDVLLQHLKRYVSPPKPVEMKPTFPVYSPEWTKKMAVPIISKFERPPVTPKLSTDHPPLPVDTVERVQKLPPSSGSMLYIPAEMNGRIRLDLSVSFDPVREAVHSKSNSCLPIGRLDRIRSSITETKPTVYTISSHPNENRNSTRMRTPDPLSELCPSNYLAEFKRKFSLGYYCIALDFHMQVIGMYDAELNLPEDSKYDIRTLNGLRLDLPEHIKIRQANNTSQSIVSESSKKVPIIPLRNNVGKVESSENLLGKIDNSNGDKGGDESSTPIKSTANINVMEIDLNIIPDEVFALVPVLLDESIYALNPPLSNTDMAYAKPFFLDLDIVCNINTFSEENRKGGADGATGEWIRRGSTNCVRQLAPYAKAEFSSMVSISPQIESSPDDEAYSNDDVAFDNIYICSSK